MNRITIAALAAAAIVTAACAGTPTRTEGGVLTDSNGMTLYTFDKDMNGKSACNGGCAKNWPPLAASNEAMASGDYSIATTAPSSGPTRASRSTRGPRTRNPATRRATVSSMAPGTSRCRDACVMAA